MTQPIFIVSVPANIYDGKYYDFRTVPIKVDASEDAIKIVNTHKEQVLEIVDRKRMVIGSRLIRYVMCPVERNVFFRDSYHGRATTISGSMRNVISHSTE